MTHCMTLNNNKVFRQFGRRPLQGKPMTWLPQKRVTVGLKWSLTKKAYVPDDNVWVYRTVALKPISGSRWQVLCEEEFWPAIQQWLRQNCL